MYVISTLDYCTSLLHLIDPHQVRADRHLAGKNLAAATEAFQSAELAYTKAVSHAALVQPGFPISDAEKREVDRLQQLMNEY